VTAFVLPAGFGKRPRKAAARRAHPEQSLQTNIASFLSWALRGVDGVFWTAIGHGGGGRLRGAILKGMGLRAGVPDLMLIVKGRPVFLEIKAGASLSEAQKSVHAEITIAGGVVRTVRSLDEVKAFLDVLGVPLRTEKPSVTLLKEAGLRLGEPQ
jgi:hypothetical protein